MKKAIICVLTVLLCLFAAVSVSAESVSKTVEGVKFSLSNEYDLMTSEDLLPSSEVKGLVFAAISKDKSHQIQGRCTTTDFSKDLVSFSGLNSEDLAPVGEKISFFSDGFETAEIGSTLYMKKTLATNDGFTVMYVTVSNGKLYTFSYFGSDPTRIGEFMATVTLPDSTKTSGSSVLVIVLLSVSIAAVAGLVVVLILSFVKDYRRRKMEQSENIVSHYIKIKRRKY